MNSMETILEFFKSKGKGENLGYDSDLFGEGYVNSLFALEMVLFLEDSFNIRLKKKDISRESFRTIRSIAEMTDRLRGKP